MNSSAIMAIFSALALGHSLFLAGHLWASVKKRPSSFFLALLLTALAVRILKSVLVILIPESPDIIPAVGLVGLMTIGPSLWFYIKSFKNVEYKATRLHLWHYVPALILIVLIPFFNEQQMFVAYCISVAHMFLYITRSADFVMRAFRNYGRTERKWLSLLLAAIFLIWTTFFAQLLIESFITYLSVTIVASITIYGLSLWAGKKTRLFTEPRRIYTEKASQEVLQVGNQIEHLLTQERIYTDSKLTVKTISERLSKPEYVVSQSVNAYFKQSFPELLNYYRIKHASSLIESNTYENLSIEGIAYESGYNSISAFYRAFKNLKGVTPAQFKKT
ncbi:helix-turn-helix domain-containing protein [Eudoraea algarum]